MKIELVFETTCPNAEGTRKLLNVIEAELGLQLNIIEINKDDPDAPDYSKKLSSPTILIDGKDAVSDGSQGGDACRIYHAPYGRLTGLPSKEVVIQSILLAGQG
ncbi:hypothetical protein [Leptospira ilyithenensis]|uniref:Thioredoxin family protein n=1 Tax=Leptospira ilyithenensis TaxID=2484901 RepID=A0A4R9LTC1_9LEPT|nr:hypothetical protein [Leptospira ilyithenensis]TGN13355.1 hypothetical protein EHS11_03745 [Leptospira ilyithenensis]